jgi:hypothetical protein
MPSYNMFQGDQNSAPKGGEEEIHVQIPPGEPSSSVADSISIIGTKVQEDLCAQVKQPAPAMWDSAPIASEPTGSTPTVTEDSPVMASRDSPATFSHTP